MKHNFKITAILLLMFLLTQFIGLYVVNAYSPVKETILNLETGESQQIVTENPLPYGMEPPKAETPKDFWQMFQTIVFSFVIAIFLIFILSKVRWKFFIKLWFFLVIMLALGISFNSFLKNYLTEAWFVALLLAVPLTYVKIYKPNVWVHNLTELLIYPGIAAIFVPILNIWTGILLLILISIYDMWAVWKSGIMQKMAKFQMEELKIFGGFLIPYLTKNILAKIRNIKKKDKNKRIKISVAILGGGDVVFPIIISGVLLRAVGLEAALFATFGAFLGLAGLLLISEKKKFYPAMPFITAGILLGILLGYLI